MEFWPFLEFVKYEARPTIESRDVPSRVHERRAHIPKLSLAPTIFHLIFR